MPSRTPHRHKEQLVDSIDQLSGQVEVLRIAIDELRELLRWAVDNGSISAVVHKANLEAADEETIAFAADAFEPCPNVNEIDKHALPPVAQFSPKDQTKQQATLFGN